MISRQIFSYLPKDADPNNFPVAVIMNNDVIDFQLRNLDALDISGHIFCGNLFFYRRRAQITIKIRSNIDYEHEMTDTIETICNNMDCKINALNDILRRLSDSGIPCPDEKELLLKIMEYRLGSIEIIKLYHDSPHSPLEIQRFHRFLSEHDFIAFFDNAIARIRLFAANKIEIDREISRFMDTTVKIQSEIENSNEKICPECKIKLSFVTTNELFCSNCGYDPCLSFDDDEASGDIKKKSKRGSYDPAKHCDFWLERIQARENIEIDPIVFEKIKECCRLDGVRMHKLTCAQIREYLHQTKLTNYNNHVPLLRKKLTGIAPPQLKDVELQLVRSYFDKVVKLFSELRPATKSNCPYHPYFVYKIVEQIIPMSSDARRRIDLLACIHLQSRETLITNDRLWESICSRIPEFYYVPTDRNDQLIEL
jgi:uncharacterized Zn finger protein (UPF0148 family)